MFVPGVMECEHGSTFLAYIYHWHFMDVFQQSGIDTLIYIVHDENQCNYIKTLQNNGLGR